MDVLCSCVNASDRLELEQSLITLGGHLIDDMSLQISHLCMSTVKITSKAIFALIEARPIVNVNYFKELVSWTKLQAAHDSPPDPQG
ncbi:unnamed protein product [Soboliphyme baturini]|uniref:BRCT domain-containing protein n=1 Tax=Soboliphyme baturini TaxID=241478 RepID=A0A183J3D6_9BILA|nr:unnamed protein product [Soboliphyme baturini]